MQTLKIITILVVTLLTMVLSIFIIRYLTGSSNSKIDDLKAPLVSNQNQTFETLVKENYGGITNKQFVIIENNKDLSEIWNRAYAVVSPRTTIPVIDFHEERVIAVFGGEFYSGGHSIEIITIEENARVLTVTVKSVSPGPDCMTTGALTQPFHIVKINKIDKQIEFDEINQIDACN